MNKSLKVSNSLAFWFVCYSMVKCEPKDRTFGKCDSNTFDVSHFVRIRTNQSRSRLDFETSGLRSHLRVAQHLLRLGRLHPVRLHHNPQIHQRFLERRNDVTDGSMKD